MVAGHWWQWPTSDHGTNTSRAQAGRGVQQPKAINIDHTDGTLAINITYESDNYRDADRLNDTYRDADRLNDEYRDVYRNPTSMNPP